MFFTASAVHCTRKDLQILQSRRRLPRSMHHYRGVVVLHRGSVV